MDAPAGGHEEGMNLPHRDLGCFASFVFAASLGLAACDGGGSGTDTDGGSGETGSGETGSGETGEPTAGGSSTGTSGTASASGTTTDGTTGGGSSTGGSETGGSSSGGSSSGGETTGGEASLPEGFEETLSGAGCADMTVYGSNPDDSIALVMHISDDLVANAVDQGETYEGTHAVEEFSTFEVLVGTQVSYPVCNDVSIPETMIDQTWSATAGEVVIVIVPEQDPPPFGTQGLATVTLSGVEVTYEGSTEVLEDITFEDIAVGWLPG